MKFKTIAVFIACIFLVNSVYSQELSKTEKKNLKKEIRKLLKEPIKYKYLKESLAVKETIVKEQSDEINQLTTERNNAIYNLKIARDSISRYQKITYDLQKKADESPGNFIDNNGLRYRLQIGLYEQFDISSFFDQLKIVSFEKTDEGLFRYTIGNFETEDEAELFKEAIRKMGIRDAFVSFYLDGSRIPKE